MIKGDGSTPSSINYECKLNEQTCNQSNSPIEYVGNDICKSLDEKNNVSPLPPPPPIHTDQCAAQLAGLTMINPGYLIKCHGLYDGVGCIIMLDTGATRSFVDMQWATDHDFDIQPLTNHIIVRTANNDMLTIQEGVRAPLDIQSISMPVMTLVFPNLLKGVHIILGMDWMAQYRVTLNTDTQIVGVYVDHQWQYIQTHTEPKRPLPPPSLEPLADPNAHLAMISADEAADCISHGYHCWLMLVQIDQDNDQNNVP